jgi:hypothetical protein
LTFAKNMSYKIQRKMYISDARPASREFLVAAAVEVGMILDRFIDVHNDIFSFSLRKILPIPWLFRPINFTQHYRTLRFIETDLELVLEQLPESCPEATELFVVLRDYTQRLLSTVLNLQDICGHLFRKADGTEEYTQQDYERDLGRYKRSIPTYQSERSRLNRILNNG